MPPHVPVETILCPFRGVYKHLLSGYQAVHELRINLKALCQLHRGAGRTALTVLLSQVLIIRKVGSHTGPN